MKRVGIALSIANLCFLFIWSEILGVASERRFFYLLGAPPDRLFFWAAAMDVIVLGAVVFVLLSVRNRNHWLKLLATVALGVITLFALYQLQRSLNRSLYSVMGERSILVLRLAAVGVIAFLIIRRPKRVLPALRGFFLILSPLFLVFAAQGLWLYYGPTSQPLAPRHTAGLLPTKASERVVWIIFDELDGRLLFPARPARIQLPHFDALREHSIFDDHVKSPAHDTLSAIPSLLLSKIIPRDENVDLNSHPVRVQFAGCTQWVNITSPENVFRRARALGFNTAVSGWYHSYCRMFGSDLSACATTAGAGMALTIPQQLLRDRPFLEKAAFLAEWQARSLPLAERLQWIAPIPDEARYSREMHIIKNKTVLKSGMQMLKNPDLNFVLLHLPIPHPPGIWNTKRQTFTTDERANYIDNLEFADRVLGEIQSTLEQMGDWNRSTVLVSTDHPYRPGNWLNGIATPALSEMIQVTKRKWQPYIPFFLKLPGQKAGVTYDREFNSVISADLLLACLQGEIRTPEQAIQWLDAHAAESEQEVCRPK